MLPASLLLFWPDFQYSWYCTAEWQIGLYALFMGCVVLQAWF
ncbi:hypothetical protein HMPREF1548_03568 [Clostridium sp. KLE 1755]|nr:hypothetical protein HMPREF1548_03568 [Clostridium sp. KLE 1755]